jgi:hypothetical protein
VYDYDAAIGSDFMSSTLNTFAWRIGRTVERDE